MSWLAPLGLLAVVAIVLVPSPGVTRAGALVRSGRLHGLTRAPTGADGAPGAAVRRLPSRRAVAVAVASACLAVGALAGIAPAIELATVSTVTAVLIGDLHRSRASALRLSQFRAAVGLLGAELRAGTPPPAALAAAGAGAPWLREELGAAAAAARHGGGTADVLAGSDDPRVRRLGVVWRVGEATGIPLADVLEQFAADLRSAADQQRAVSVALAGPRSSAVLLCLLPALGIGLGAAMGARPLPLLFGTSAGRVLCCAGLLLDATGVLWVRRILLRAAAQ